MPRLTDKQGAEVFAFRDTNIKTEKNDDGE